MSSPLNDGSTAAAQDGLYSISQMLEGTQQLPKEPGVVYSLFAGNAHPSDAQAVDQFMQSLDAEKQVNIARSTGEPINLSAEQQAMLTANGVKFDDVLPTSKNAAQQAIQKIQQATGGQYTAKTNPDGTLALDKNGQIQQVAVAKPKSSGDSGGGGLLDAIGGFIGHVGHDLKNWTIDAGQGLNKGLNFVESAVAPNGFQNPLDSNSNDITQQILKNTDTQDMQSQGYDPSSIWSTLAFKASGRAHTSLASLNDTYGQDKVDEALRFMANPSGYRKSIENDPASWTTSADGRPALTPAAAAKLQYLSSSDFSDLAKQVNAHQATIGHDLANALGLDPTKESVIPGAGISYNSVAGTTDTVAAFALDPTLLALRGVQAMKAAQVGVDWMKDGDGAAKVLTNQGFFARRVQNGWQTAIDLGNQIRKARAEGDVVGAAKAADQFSKLPLAPLMEDFVGNHAFVKFRNPTEAELADPKFDVRSLAVMGETGGIRSMDDAAAFIRDTWGRTRLLNGGAAIKPSTMPGALSAYGMRWVRMQTAGWMTQHSAKALEEAKGSLISQAEADPELAQKLVDDNILRKVEPQADDAVDVYSQKVIAYRPADSAHEALGNLMGALRESGPGISSAMSEHAALSDELDSLEARMQALSADKTADPAELEHVQDSIQTGRQLLDMVEQGLTPATKDIKAAQDKLKEAEAALPRVVVPGEQAPADSFNLRLQTTKTTQVMPSQARAQYEVTDTGIGTVVRNMRTRGDVLGEMSGRGAIHGLFSPTAIAWRAAKASQTLSMKLLPRNTEISLFDPRAAETIERYAAPWVGRGQASILRAAYVNGDEGVRKSIISGLKDQIIAASGMSKSKSGADLMARMRTDEEYSAAGTGPELNGQKLALTDGQTTDRWTLPSYQEIQKASRRFGFWDATMGRAFTAPLADTLMSQWKIGALFRGATVTRNMLEGWLRTMLDGSAGEAVQARAIATARNKELWDYGYGLDDLEAYKLHAKNVDQIDAQLAVKGKTQAQRSQLFADRRAAKGAMDRLTAKPIVQHHLAVEAGNTDLAKQIENGSMLSGQILGRSTPTMKLADLAPLATVGRAYRSLYFKHMDPEHIQAIVDLGPQRLADYMEGYGQQMLGSLGFDRATKEITEAAQAGYGASKVRVTAARALERGKNGTAAGAHTVWTHEATDGTIGADRYARHLGRLVNASPETTRAILDHLEGNASIEDVVDAMSNEQKHTAYGSLFWDDESTNEARRAATPDEVALGKQQFAQKVVDEFKYVFSGRNGKYQQELADYVRGHGYAPDGGWIADHLTKDNRPESALAPDVMVQPNGGSKPASLAGALQDLEGAAYAHMVERPLQRLTSSPVFLAHYAKSRVALNPMVEDLVANGGLSREAANALAEDLAGRQAWIKTENLIDDPGQKTQFDVLARNMFPFARATNAMVRRWGSGLWQNPVAARKMMLAYEGAVHSGFIYDNAYGEPTFTYPASGVMNMVTRDISLIPGFGGGDGFQYPIAGDMTGGVLMSVPGADNPFRMSMGPMLSMPLRYVYKHFLPTAWRGDALSVDSFINGPVGAGEILPQLVPTVVRNVFKNMVASDRNSALASSVNGAIANLAAAGLVPAPDAPNADLQKFRARLQTQVWNQLFARAIFGYFAPAAPSQPTEGTSASGADFAWSVEGIKQLSDEYKTILNEVNGNTARANAIFVAMHPDKVIYKTLNGGKGKTVLTGSAMTEARSAASATGAYLPATASAMQWMTDHEGFIKNYSSVAAYFLPNSASNEPFSSAAYQAQLELGLRQKKTPEQFMNDIYVKHAESQFYPGVKEWDQQIADAKASGNQALASTLTSQKSAWEKEYQALNPMFGQKISSYPDTRTTAKAQLSDLKLMLAKGDVPDGQAPKLQALLNTWDNYNQFIAEHPGTDAQTKALHTAALDVMNQWAEQNLAGTPLADVFNGVFRPLNTNLTKLNTTEG